MLASEPAFVIAACFLVIFLCHYTTVYEYLFTFPVLVSFSFFNCLIGCVTGSLDLEIGSRMWLFRKISTYLSLPLGFGVAWMSLFKLYGSDLPEDSNVPTVAILLFSLFTAFYWGFLLKFDYQMFLVWREEAEWSSLDDELAYRSVGRFRVREDDDDFKCFTSG